jgi:Tfp pilus assembly protein PilO
MQIKGKKIILQLSSLVIILVLIFAVILPLSSKLKQVAKNVEDQRVTLEITQKKAQNTASLISDYDKIKSYQQEISKFFINKKDQLDFLTSLENTAQENNLTQVLTLEEVGKIEQIKDLPLSIVLTGNYLDIIKYLAEIEALNYYISIESINLSKQSSSTAALNNVTATIESKTYWQEL